MDRFPDSLTSSVSAFPRASCQACWVIKLGGSLLDLPDLTERLRAAISQTTTKPLLVVGGGPAADCVRKWEQIHHLGSTAAHWLAIRAMEFNQRLVESLLPEARGVSSLQEAEAVWHQKGIAVLDAFGWLRSKEGTCDSLPHSWDVASDSIAACAALGFSAAGLVLLKSTEAPPGFPAVEGAGEPFVDRYFARCASRLPQIVWWNLRNSDDPKKTASRKS